MKHHLLKISFFAVLFLAGSSVSAKLTLHKTCSDGMVLQQQTQAKIWGWSDGGKQITVRTSWNNAAYSSIAGSDGKWEVKVDTPAASYTNYEISVSCGKENINIKDVLIGEVWMASGQSNMEMTLLGYINCPVEGYLDIVAEKAMPDQIRMLTVANYSSPEPLEDIHETMGWEKAGPQTVSRMSATAYFFALQLNKSLDVPVGIIAFARGASRVEGWLPKEDLIELGEDISPEGLKRWGDLWKPYLCYYGMEQPVKGYTTKGFIWYQGCSNVTASQSFAERTAALVKKWRADWGDTEDKLPFYMVEISPYIYGSTDNLAPALRQAQHDAVKMTPNTGIVVTNDLVYSYEANNIHPSRKQEVGKRLAFMALHRDYGYTQLACDSPEAVEAFNPEGKPEEIRVKLSNCSHGVNRCLEVEGLEICGSEGVWYPVSTISFNYKEQTISIKCPEVPDPKEARYGWGEFRPGNLANTEGLGFVPFWIKINK